MPEKINETNMDKENESSPEKVIYTMNNTARKNKRPFTVVVEGNIGSGKTTFLKYYDNLMSTEVFMEPVDKWKNLDGNNLLELMYKEPKRHSFTFQSYVQLTMAEVIIPLEILSFFI